MGGGLRSRSKEAPTVPSNYGFGRRILPHGSGGAVSAMLSLSHVGLGFAPTGFGGDPEPAYVLSQCA